MKLIVFLFITLFFIKPLFAKEEIKFTFIITESKKKYKNTVATLKPIFNEYLNLIDGFKFIPPYERMDDETLLNLNKELVSIYGLLNTKNFSEARVKLDKILETITTKKAVDDKIFLARFFKAMGVAYGGLSLIEDAKSYIKTSIFLFPNQKSSEYDYSLEIKSLFMDAKKEIEETPSSSITIKTKPSGARIYIDGEFKGVSPIKFSGLEAGFHVFQFKIDGYKERLSLLKVSPDMPNKEVRLELEPASYFKEFKKSVTKLKKVRKQNKAKAYLLKLKSIFGCDEVGFIKLSETKTSYKTVGFYITKTGNVFEINDQISKSGDIFENIKNFILMQTGGQLKKVKKVESLGTFLLASKKPEKETEEISENLIINPDNPMFKVKKKKKKKESIFKKWWFWTGVGVVALGVGGGIYLLATSGEQSSTVPLGSIKVNISTY